jgi:hypothetical protein
MLPKRRFSMGPLVLFLVDRQNYAEWPLHESCNKAQRAPGPGSVGLIGSSFLGPRNSSFGEHKLKKTV